MWEELDYKWLIAGFAAIISLSNLIYYLSTVLKGKTKPHMFTWLVWGLITVTAAFGQIHDGGGIGGYYTLLIGFNCFTIATLAYIKGTKDITQSDKICLLFCFLAIGLWPLTKSPLLSVIIVTFIDLIGGIPTVRKSFNNPHEENLISFSIYIITYSLSILALENYTIITLFYPISITIGTLAMALFLIVRRYQLGYKIWA